MTLLFVAAISSCSSQIALNCLYHVGGSTAYYCELNNIEVLDPEESVVFEGDHVDGRTDANVTTVIIRNSNTPFIIPQIFTSFENIDTLEVEDSQLESLAGIPETILFHRLQFDGNNITRLEAGFLQNQTELTYFSAIDSNILEIDEEAFVGLSSLQDLILIGNNIQEIAPLTFHPLINLRYLDLEANSLTSIGEDLFSQSPLLFSIYMEWNQINEIAPRFSANFPENLDFINLSGNECVNRSFQIGPEETLIILHNVLRPCFNNFNGRTTDERDLKAEFTGSLRIFDEFDNLIGSV